MSSKSTLTLFGAIALTFVLTGILGPIGSGIGAALVMMAMRRDALDHAGDTYPDGTSSPSGLKHKLIVFFTNRPIPMDCVTATNLQMCVLEGSDVESRAFRPVSLVVVFVIPALVYSFVLFELRVSHPSLYTLMIEATQPAMDFVEYVIPAVSRFRAAFEKVTSNEAVDFAIHIQSMNLLMIFVLQMAFMSLMLGSRKYFELYMYYIYRNKGIFSIIFHFFGYFIFFVMMFVVAIFPGIPVTNIESKNNFLFYDNFTAIIMHDLVAAGVLPSLFTFLFCVSGIFKIIKMKNVGRGHGL